MQERSQVLGYWFQREKKEEVFFPRKFVLTYTKMWIERLPRV